MKAEPLYPRHADLQDDADETIETLQESLRLAVAEKEDLRDELRLERLRHDETKDKLAQALLAIQRRAHV